MFKLKGLTVQERSWVLYDIANSAFILTVITVLFPILSKTVAESEGYDSQYVSSVFLYTTSAIAAIVALISPFLGSLIKYDGNKKKYFKICLGLGIVGAIFLVIPDLNWISLMIAFVISSIGYNLTNVIYDSYLNDITTDERADKISSVGYGMGYVGSMIPSFVGLIPYALVTFGILDVSYTRISISFAFIVSIGWWFFYSVPLLKNVEQKKITDEEPSLKNAIKGVLELAKNFKKYKPVFIFMIAYLLYIDVVNSVIRLATIIGGDLNIGNTTLLIMIAIVQLVAFPSAIIFGNFTKKIGAKKMLSLAIIVYAISIMVVWQITADRTWLIYIVAVLVGSVQGGIQAISRSYFAKMVPKEKSNEFFGIFSVFGRVAGIFSPFLLATLYAFTDLTVNQSVLFLTVPLFLGWLLLMFVNENKIINEENASSC